MTRADRIYEDCLQFWQRMGVTSEDKCMALSMLDVVNTQADG